jgi:PAS domain S-box-containing protein
MEAAMKKSASPPRTKSPPARKQNPRPRLRRSADDFSPFFDSPLDLLCIGDRYAIFRKLNPQWETVLGYSVAEMEGKDFIEFIHPDDQAAALDAFREIDRRDGVQVLTNRVRRKDGSYRWLEWKYLLRDGRIFAAARDVTERKQTEKALRESEERYQRITLTITDYIYHVRVKNGIAVETIHGERCQAVTGYSAEEFAADPHLWLRMMDPEDRPLVVQQVRAVLTGRYAPTLEHRLWRKDGVRRWVRNTPVLHCDPAGDLLGYDGLIQDITERKEAELQIRAQYELALALNATTNRDEGLRLCLAAAMRISGMEAGGVYLWDLATGGMDLAVERGLPSDLADLVRHLDPDRPEARWMLEGQSIFTNYQDLTSHMPSIPKPYEGLRTLIGIPIRYENQVIGFLNLVSASVDSVPQPVREALETTVAQMGNAIARLRSEAELRESRRMLEIILDTIPVRVFWKDRDSRFLGCNRWFALDAGFSSPADLIGRDDYQMGWSEQAELYRSDDRMVIESGREKTGYEEPQTRADGKRIWLRTSKAPLRDPDGKIRGVLGTYEDITDKKLAEEEIRTLNNELEQRVALRTAQLEATNRELEAFSYSISHDLRAPLRAIDGFTRALEEDYGGQFDAEGRRLCAVIRRNTRRMNELVDSLLTLSRLSRTEMRCVPTDMEALARSVAEEFAPAENRGRIEWAIGALPRAAVDPVLFRQVWTNLMANAVKFTSKCERARIEIGSRGTPEEDVYFIRDNGAGFDNRFADRLFGVFQRLHDPDEYEGNGVGLAIVQRIIHRHGGRVWAEGEPGQGAVFYFALPRTPRPESPPA